jgi:hypothetical protein
VLHNPRANHFASGHLFIYLPQGFLKARHGLSSG